MTILEELKAKLKHLSVHELLALPNLPPLPKSLGEYVNQDREDRF